MDDGDGDGVYGDIEKPKSCSECGGRIRIESGADTCIDCGIVFGNTFDFGAEWRNDVDGPDGTRCGMPINKMLLESSYSTGSGMSYAGKKYKDIYRHVKRTINYSS